jgi:hypothetical protein
MSTSGDPKASTTVVVGIVGAILGLALVLFTQVLFYNTQRLEDERKLYGPKPQELSDLQFKQLVQLHDRHYVDPEKTIVTLPIDDAIELYVAKMNRTPAPTTIRSGATPTTEPLPKGAP